MKIVAALACLMLLVACQRTDSTEVIVGVIGPFSGPAATFGEWGKQGFVLAAERVYNETGVKMSYVFEDDRCEAAGTVSAINKLHTIDGANLIVGLPCGSGTKAGTPLATELGILVVTAGDNFGHESDNWYTTRFAIHEEVKTLAHFAYNTKSARKVGIIYFENEWGVTSKDQFTKEFESLGGTVVGAEGYGWAASDFRTSLLKFKQADVDAVYMIYNNIGDIVNQIEELGMDVTMLGDSQIETEQTVTVGGENLEGVLYARPVGGDAPSVGQFAAAYEAKHGHAPDTLAIDSHDAALVLGYALAECESADIECLKVAVQNTKDLPGANGFLTFNTDIWGFEKEFVIKTYRDGAFTLY